MIDWQLVTDAARSIAIGCIFVGVGYMAKLMLDARHYARSTDWHTHAYGLGASYILFAIGCGLEMQSRLGTPATWRTPIFVAGGVIGLVSQVITRRALERRE